MRIITVWPEAGKYNVSLCRAPGDEIRCLGTEDDLDLAIELAEYKAERYEDVEEIDVQADVAGITTRTIRVGAAS